MRWRSDREETTVSPSQSHESSSADEDEKHMTTSLDYDEAENSSTDPLVEQEDMHGRLEASSMTSASSSSSSSSGFPDTPNTASSHAADNLLANDDTDIKRSAFPLQDSGGEDKSTPDDGMPNQSLDPPERTEDTARKEAASIIEDDDGADHAEDVPPVTWKPQNVQSTCEFTHTIEDYAQKRESGCKKAEYSSVTVDEYGNRWRLIVYVNGNGRASNHHLSLFLQVADADDLPFGWKKSVSYVLTLEHPNGGSLSYAKRNPDKTFKMCPKAIDWGWSQFITSDRIQQEGFVANDKLTVRASVTVKSSSVKIDEEDAELYLKCAAEEGDAEAVKLCLDQGASVNCKFKDDLYTPLHTACSSGTHAGSMEVLNLLLERGADGNACNKWRETPLLIAANNGHRAAVQALLKHGADPSMCSEAGWSALTFAAHKGYDDIVALLLRAGAPVSCPVTEDASTPLHKACAGSKSGHLACVKLLLEGGVDVHALNKWRETPLLTAANHGQAGAVAALLSAGADPCKCTDTGWSPLSIAAYKGHDEVVRLLLEEGAPTEEDDPTLSALLQAATKGLPDTVELLLRHGADHTVTTKKGDTALSILVEQNMIDAAVEMVSKYGASIPRCSRDRKKVQRARLSINLRMKQLDKEGKNATLSTDEESDGDDSSGDDEAAETTETKDHKDSGKKGGKKKSAEAKAKAAEEALLLELEQEAEEAKKMEAEANNKRAKKRAKKQRERHQRMKEEQERREREKREAEERDRARRDKEEKQRMELEAKLREEREREAKEKLEREKILAAKFKAREEREKRERELKEQERQQRNESTGSLSPSGSSSSERRVKAPKPKRSNGSIPTALPKTSTVFAPKMNKVANEGLPTVISGGVRRRDSSTKSKTSSRPLTKKQVAPTDQQTPGLPRQSPELEKPVAREGTSVLLAPRLANPGLNANAPHFLPIDTRKVGTQTVEHPAVSIFRKQKMMELVDSCSKAFGIVDESLVKRVFHLWTVRAAHGDSLCLDPIIPSWTASDQLIAFFQRQLISESRRMSGTSLVSGMEAWKEAGASIASSCQVAAREVVEYRQRVDEHLARNWNDSDIGMSYHDCGSTSPSIMLSWSNQAEIVVSTSEFDALRERYVGPSSRFLAAVFVAQTVHDTRQALVTNTSMDCRLSPATKACLVSEFALTAELWCDPLSVSTRGSFWGIGDPSDAAFGGRVPFGKNEQHDDILVRNGGSVSVFLPMDNTCASQYMKRIVDVLDKANLSNVPVSFAVFVHKESLRERQELTETSVRSLEPRLCDARGAFLRRVKVLLGGKHQFYSGNGTGVANICSTNSLFLLLQNDSWCSCYGTNDAAVTRVIDSMSAVMELPVENHAIGPIGYKGDFHLRNSPLTLRPGYLDGLPQTPDTQRSISQEVAGTSLPTAFSPSDHMPRARRGRLFDLVDDGEDDHTHEEDVDVDLVSGMLNSLDVGLFQTCNIGQDVDIEAISLMGIGAPTSHTLHSSNSQPGPFG